MYICRRNIKKKREFVRLGLSIIALTILGATMFPSLSIATEINAALISDPKPDFINPARMEALEVPSEGIGMNAVFYLASGAGLHPTMLLLHGTPGNEQNLDLAQAARRDGWNVLTMHYRGSWGAAGKYSLSNALVDTTAAMDFLRIPENVAKYHIDVKKLVIAGHSTGGYNAASYAAKDHRIAGVVLIDAWNAAPDVSPPDRAEFIEYVKKSSQALVLGSPENYVGDFLSRNPLVNLASSLAGVPILIVGAEKANGAENKILSDEIAKIDRKNLQTFIIETDHSFSDHRIELSNIFLNWLDTIAKVSKK